MTEIKSADDVDSNVGFGATEWQEDLFVSLTRLAKDDDFDQDTSQISYKDTYYWNREAKDGDLAGRVLLKSEERWYALFVNNNKNEEQSIKLEYGAAVRTILASTVLGSTFFLTYVF